MDSSNNRKRKLFSRKIVTFEKQENPQKRITEMKAESFMLKIFLVASILLAFVPKGLALEKTRTAEPVTKKTQAIEKETGKAEWEMTLRKARDEGEVAICGVTI